ncbi:SDR family oxidoreductase [Pendulispora rubella]|uniref:SDR family oxidoreductase n=1 Tax=Pendulispora rubella TaxID=2741070 RepID=A0ABZ2L280_9BACT
MDKLKGKIAVVTGGNSGVGLATAQRFAADGAHVFVLVRRQSELDNVVRKVGHNVPGSVTGIEGDVANVADLDRLYEAVRERGRIDILFANAALGEFAPVSGVSEAHFDKAMGLNVKGLVFTVEKALPLFRDGGSIILNASPGAGDGVPALSMYGAVKSALRSFARCWTADLSHRQIRVNVVSPRPTEAYGLQGIGQMDVLAEQASLMAGLPPGKAGISMGIANVAAVLASDESSFITGLEVFVDGGPSLN